MQDKFETNFLADLSVFRVSLKLKRRSEDAVDFPGTLNNFLT